VAAFRDVATTEGLVAAEMTSRDPLSALARNPGEHGSAGRHSPAARELSRIASPDLMGRRRRSSQGRVGSGKLRSNGQ
jgi:hypothetical protein